MPKNTKQPSTTPPGGKFLDETYLAGTYPLVAARMEHYRLEYSRSKNPLHVWRVIEEYILMARGCSLSPVYPPWCCEYLEKSAHALRRLAAPAGLQSYSPRTPPQKARLQIPAALGFVSRGASAYGASARDMASTEVGISFDNLRSQGTPEKEVVGILAAYIENDERTITRHRGKFRNKIRKIKELSEAARAKSDKT